jgi:Ca2+-binding EF-hand superfamily protein
MTMKEYQIMMMDELNSGNIETYNDMNKCLREAGYNPTEAYVAYINIPEDACNTPENEPESDEFV